VPHVRGRFDHRPIGDILGEVRRRVADGAREITLVGQTVNAYKDPGGDADFADLLARTADIDGVERITFVTSHPKDFNAKLVRTLATVAKINPRLHLPMQSGSNPVLRKMNRKYTIEEYRAKIDLFREHCPGWSLSTDLIVAFPGETDEDFALTLDVCREIGFAQAFTFVYSPRRGTPAARWTQISAEVGGARLRELASVVDDSATAFHRMKLGTTVRALIVGPSRKDRAKLAARTIDNVTVIAPDTEGETASPRPYEPWLDIQIDAAHRWGCTGTIVGRAATFEGAARRVQMPVFDLI
jgi:tRNA-2-methylthio-N6-dimethylallyladenosine synthase